MPCDTEYDTDDNYRFTRIDLTEYKALDALVGSVKCTYGTVIDTKCLLDFKGENAFAVALAIAEEGEKVFYNYLLQKGNEYYCYCNDVFQMINDQLKRIFSVNLELLISGKKKLKGEETTIETTDCDIELEKAIVNYNHVESLFMLKGLTGAQYIEQTYLIIQSIIITHTITLNRIGSFIGEEFAFLIQPDQLKKHKSMIATNIKKLNNLLMVQGSRLQEDKNAKTPLYKVPESIIDIYTHRDPMVLQDFKDALSKYLSHLESSIKEYPKE